MHELGLTVDAAVADSVCDQLAEACGAVAVTVEDADAGSDSERPVFDEPGVGDEGGWRSARITALFDAEADATEAAGVIASTHDGVVVRTIRPVDDRDWVRLTQSQFGPTEIAAGFWIVPTWSPVPHDARHVVRLDPGMAFGTGTHPTTRMVLRWMVAASAQVPDGASWPRVLDYGCGSGILAIAAKRLGAVAVDAIDIDPAAIEATRRNAAANAVDLHAGLPELADASYALVLANILSTPLKLLAPLLCGLVADGGELVLSGVLERQAEELRHAYASWLDLRVVDRDEGWILLHARRGGEQETR